MGTASRPTAAPATMPQGVRAARHVLPAAATVVAVAVLLRLVYRPWFLNYDARYALVWARDIARGLTPDYTGPYAPTPHPLETIVSLVAVPFGQGGDAIMVWAVLLCFGVLVWLAYRLGAELFSPAVGVVTALVVLTRPALERDALLGYQDTAFAVLILWAVLLEARREAKPVTSRQARQGRGAPVLVLLAVAGLMRPEAWALAGLYALYVWRGASNRERATYVGLTALAPVLWALMDWLVTGDALHSLHGTAALAETVDRRRDPLTGPYWTAKYLGYTLREPLVVGIPIGLVFAYRRRLRGAVLPLAVAAAMLAVFLASPLFGLPLIGRYVRTPASLLALFYGLAVFGWRMLPPGEARRRWAITGVLAAALSLAFLPWHVNMLSDLHDRLVNQGAYYRDLRAVGQAPAVRAALRRCGPLATADHRPIPHLRWWLDSDPGTVAPVTVPAAVRGSRLLLLPRRTRPMRRFYSVNFPTAKRPTGSRLLYRNASWRVFAASGC
ncbi:MAG: hypothetical protein ABI611_05495 [Solirubrobacteraceae bacterium]